jgi:pyridoxine 5-phosphate synthase
MTPHSKTALSVNVNKVALLRNSRHLGIPSVLKAAQMCLEAGADGITIHPRPDERHIRASDVIELAELMKRWPDREFNIEGNPFHQLMDFVRTFRPHQVTFVPDSEGQFTSDHGWSFPKDAAKLKPLIEECKSLGVRVSLFMDPEPDQMQAVQEIGADRVELYTEPYAATWGRPENATQLQRYADTAVAALQAGLGVNAGHDLNRDNLPAFVVAVKGLQEVSIGHAFMADALELGYSGTVEAYMNLLVLGDVLNVQPQKL